MNREQMRKELWKDIEKRVNDYDDGACVTPEIGCPHKFACPKDSAHRCLVNYIQDKCLSLLNSEELREKIAERMFNWYRGYEAIKEGEWQREYDCFKKEFYERADKILSLFQPLQEEK